MFTDSVYKIKSLTKKVSKRSVVLSPKNVKRLNADDLELDELKKMFNENTRLLFGDVDIKTILYQKYKICGIYNEINKLVGVAVFDNCPNTPAISPRDWETWIYNFYGLFDVNSRNTIWINLLLYTENYYNFFLAPIIQYIFQERYLLKYCIMLIPPGKHKTEFLNNLGVAVSPKGVLSKKSTQYLFVMSRNNFIARYKLRKAVEEDNDDIIPLIDSYCPLLKEMYGSYYVAEILTRFRDSGRQIVVAEYEGVAVAVLCLNDNINYEVLLKQFELVPYNGLKKANPQDTSVMTLDHVSPSNEQLNMDATENIRDLEHENVLSAANAIETESTLHSDSEDYVMECSAGSIFLYLDEEECPLTPLTLDGNMSPRSTPEEFSEYFAKSFTHLKTDRSQFIVPYTSTSLLDTLPQYHGEPNAFLIEIATAHPDHQNSLMDLFEAAFHCYSNKEYCLVSMPSTTAVTREFKYFGRVVPRPTGTFPHELYAMHRNSLFGDVYAMPIKNGINLPEMRKMVAKIHNCNEILTQITDSLTNPKSTYQCFMLKCACEIVGIATVTDVQNLQYLITHYDLEDFVHPNVHSLDSHGVIENCTISPIFQRHTMYFLREIHRLSLYDILYYKLVPSDASNIRRRPLMCLISNLFHIMPRRQPQYDPETLKEYEFSPSITATTPKQDTYALFLSTKPICGTRRHICNNRIVILGCSSTSLAFLESLIYKQDLHFRMIFNNVTVVCKPGISFPFKNQYEEFFVKKHFYDPDYVDKLALKTYVNFVEGQVTRINRKEKNIILDNTTQLQYDLLFLMCGDMFQKPPQFNANPFHDLPDNVFLINSHNDASYAISNLRQIIIENKTIDYKIIIYGHHLQSYCTLEGLLIHGVPGKHLIFIENFPYHRAMEKKLMHNVSIFNNPEVDEVIRLNIAAEGITMYSSYYFIDWSVNRETNMITAAKFESRHKMLEIECIAMFYFNEKGISRSLQKVISKAGLVYDGRIVIDHNCRTNDRNIYAAGTLTKYSRKYYAPSKSHKFFNRVEIGRSLGLTIKQLIAQNNGCPFYTKKTDWHIQTEKSTFLLPNYTKPLLRYCRLPSGLYYLSIEKPGIRIPLETKITQEEPGRILTTGDCKNLSKQGFFRLHLNNNRRVESITCLAKLPLDVQNLYCLWGKSETLLNNLSERFEMVLITDLFDYFREPWAYAIYHDKFNDLIEELNYLMTSTIGFAGTSIVTKLITAYKNSKWKELSEESRDEIEEEFDNLPYKEIIEEKLLNFLKKNLAHLPMYAHPVIIKDILKNFENSPMFS